MKIKRWLSKQSYTVKVFFILVSIVFISLFITQVALYYSTSKIIGKSTNKYLKNLSSVTISKLNDTIKNVEDVAFYVNGDDDIQKMLKEEMENSKSGETQYFTYNEIKKQLQDLALLRQEINGINIFTESKKNYGYEKQSNDKPVEIENYIKKESQYWVNDKKRLLYIKEFYSFPGRERLGRIAVDVNIKEIYEIIADIDTLKKGRVMLLSRDGYLITTDDQAGMGKELELSYRPYYGDQESFYEAEIIGGKRYNIYNSPPTRNGWHILFIMPMDDYMENIIELRNVTVMITAISLCLGLLAAAFVSRRSTKSIRNIAKAMEAFGQGDFEVLCPVDSEDEIGRLGDSFNKMVEDMNSLVKTVFEQKLMKQKAQMESLQLQINPHFLYNTLDTINWMARIKKADDIGDMVASLGNMMRYSLGKTAFVTLKEEVKNLKDYIYIQTRRYGEKMTAVIDIEEEYYSCYIPRLLIQPIVENAIVHGIEEKLDNGHIRVWAKRQGQDILLCVEDDGVGMTEETMLSILNASERNRKKGHTSVGIANVNKRIQMIYGEGYGLTIQSVLGSGTKMVLRVKMLYEVPD